MARTGFYSGSFDPITNGHIDVIRRAAAVVDRLVIGIGIHPGKSPLFSVAEKVSLIEADTAAIAKATGCRIETVTFGGLTVDAAKTSGATLIFRGLRDGTDLDYEMQMSGMNGAMMPAIHTVFLPASPDVRHITATLVRQIAQMGGNVESFVTTATAAQLAAKLQKK